MQDNLFISSALDANGMCNVFYDILNDFYEFLHQKYSITKKHQNNTAKALHDNNSKLYFKAMLCECY